MRDKMSDLANIIEFLHELEDDNTIPRNVKTKITSVIQILEDEGDQGMNINRALDELEKISNDTNMQPFTRTQIWNIVSLLENI
ncbi:MAG: UPF0147 family protein [Candidatus Woesearchaeota archaeon]